MSLAPNHARKARGFTMVELLVAFSIVALLVVLILPSLAKARAAQSTMQCQVNMRSQIHALAIYQGDYAGFAPHRSPAALAGTDFAGTAQQPDAEWDSTDPMAGMAIWGVRAGNVGQNLGMGQVIAGGYLGLSNMFCPGMIASEENCVGEGSQAGGTGVMGKWRRWEWRQWVYDESVAGGFSSTFYVTWAGRTGGIGGFNSVPATPNSDTNNYMVRASYGYRSGDYSYVTHTGGAGQQLDTAGSVATGNNINIALAAQGVSPINSAGFGVRGKAFAGAELAKPDNAVNDSSRTILCENFANQHLTFRRVMISGTAYGDDMNVAYADGSVGFRTDINQTLTGAPTSALALAMNNGTFTWSGGGTLNGAKGFYFEQDTVRRNRRRGGDRVWQPGGFAGAFTVGGGGVAPARTSMFAALDACAKISR